MAIDDKRFIVTMHRCSYFMYRVVSNLVAVTRRRYVLNLGKHKETVYVARSDGL